jgi:oligo-1,6-glucosidase/alpha-glucosidase
MNGLNLAFLWDLLNLKSRASFFRKVIEHYEYHYPKPYIPVYVYGNHDRKRMASHFDGDMRIAKLLALIQFTVRGVPVTYYGEEIGMVDGGFAAKTALDPLARNFAWVPSFLFDMLGFVNRDDCRTPMQWDAGPNAGFCSAEVTPWLPVDENRNVANVRDQLRDKESLLNVYRALLQLRREQPVLQTGDLVFINEAGSSEHVLAYQRYQKNQTILVALNMGPKTEKFHNPTECEQMLFCIGVETPVDPSQILLPPYTGIVLGN